MSLSFEKKRILYAAVYPFLFILLLWLIGVLQFGMSWNLSFFGIRPRNLTGIIGIFTNCFIHADINHLWANTLSSFVLMWFLFYFYHRIAWSALGGLWLLTGALLWSIGRSGVHVGASGLVYGLAFFLFFSGVLRRKISLMAVSLVVTFLYGSIVWGMMPFAELIKPDMSWEGHLSGAVSGAVMSLLLMNKGPQREEPFDSESDEDEENPDEENPFWAIPDNENLLNVKPPNRRENPEDVL